MSGIDLNSEIISAGLAPQPVSKFLEAVSPLDSAERRLIVDQALLLMEQVYVHLPLKRAMHAVDPVQRLRLLRHRLELISERAFHEEMISTFMGVRDLHTNYILPDPYNRSVAFLPFEIREFFRGRDPVHIVGGVLQGFQHPTFKPGVIVTHWNGVPIARAIELNARRHAGSNAAANHAHGLERLTFRPLMMSLPPDEDWVDLRYLAADGMAGELRFDWKVSTQSAGGGNALVSAGSSVADPSQAWRLAQGVDPQTEAVHRIKKHLFDHAQVEIEDEVMHHLQRVAHGYESTGPNFDEVSTMPDVFQFGIKDTGHGQRAYLRIATFAADDAQRFADEFVRILELLPTDGLILDVRGNGGGNINAGELLLQTLTGEPIEPERLHFLTSTAMAQLVDGVTAWFGPWQRSMQHGLLTGAAYSQGLPITDPVACNAIGRKYPGKVVLLTDAFCYSTTDIFAAGFQDHGIGKVIGNHACTGAGGANVFEWDLLVELFDSFAPKHEFRLLPKGAGLRVAIRRTTRVRANAGVPLEDLGVEPDALHLPTLADLTEGDRELFELAAELTR